MSLPIARARRKKVPSIQRSPYSQDVGPTRGRESSKPSVVMSQASWSCGDLPLVLDQPHLGDARGRSRASRALVGRRPARSTGRRHAAEHPGLAGAARARASSSSMWRTSRPERVARSPSATGAGRPTARRTAGRGRTRRSRASERGPGVEHATRRPSMTQHGVAGLVAGEVGVGGVGAEPVVGVVGAHLVAARRAAPAARRGRSRPAGPGARRHGSATGCAGEVELAVAPARCA